MYDYFPLHRLRGSHRFLQLCPAHAGLAILFWLHPPIWATSCLPGCSFLRVENFPQHSGDFAHIIGLHDKCAYAGLMGLLFGNLAAEPGA